MSLDVLRTQFRRLRRDRGLSQGAVARILDVCQSTVSGFEQGRYRCPRSETLVAMRDLVRKWESAGDGTESPRRPEELDRCPDCAAAFPNVDRPIHFCWACGAYLAACCTCGAVTADARASYCAHCGEAMPIPVNPEARLVDLFRTMGWASLLPGLVQLFSHIERMR